MSSYSRKFGKIFFALLLELGLVASWCLSAIAGGTQEKTPVLRVTGESAIEMTGETPVLLVQSYRVGDKVEVLWEGKWYPAKIFDRQAGSYCITYVGYDRSWDECVEGDRIRYPERAFGNIDPQRGERVDLLWRGNWYPAIVYDMSNDFYCITYIGYDRSWDECVESDRLREYTPPPVDGSAEPLLIEANNLIEESYDFVGYGQRYQQGLENAEKALAIYRQIDNRSGEVEALYAVGWAYYWMNEYVKALDYYQQSLELAREIGDTDSATSRLFYIGRAYMYLGDYKNSIKYQEEYLQIGEDTDNDGIKTGALRSIGDSYYFQKNYEKALEYYQQSLELGSTPLYLGGVFTALGMHDEAISFFEPVIANPADIYTKSVALNQLGLNYLALGEYKKAIDYFEQQLAIARETEQIYSEWEAFKGLGSTFFKMGELKKAEKSFRAAIKAQETIREKVGDNDRLKVSLFDTQTDAYQDLQEVLVANNKPKKALEIAERGRGRAFVELLFNRISPEAAERANIEPPTFKQIKKIAKEQNATLVEYSIVRDKLYIWGIKPNGKMAFRQVELSSILEDSSLNDLVIDARNGLFVLPHQPTAKLQKLYQVLIEPIADFLPKNPEERVVFIPQGKLFLVPFVALMDAEEKYLIEKHAILTSPAISILELTRQQRENNLEFNPKDTLVVGLPRNSEDNNLVIGNPAMPKIMGEPLAPLQGAEAEAEEIASFLNTEAILGSNATKKALIQKIENSRIVHIATHGLLDDISGLGIPGALALAPDGIDNGFLTSAEIMNLDINAELVVLSACDTGRGDITGDGVVGLSRSFIAAGTPSIIVSLWKVPDDSTQALMVEFYRQLDVSKDKALALRNAMLKTMADFPEPKNWAAFTLIGEAE